MPVLCDPSFMHRVVLGCVLVLTGCTDRPLAETTDATATTSTTSTTASPETTVAAPTDTDAPPSPTSSSHPTTTDPALTTDTTDSALTTGTPDTTSTSPPDTTSTTDATTDTTTTDALPACGECPATWVHAGHLDLQPGADLTPFICLGEVTGHFSLVGDFTAAELAVFANLRHTARFALGDNAVLTDLSAFACLETASQGIFLVGAPALADISALAGVTTASELELSDLAITALPPFAPGFGELHDITLIDLPHLTDLGPLAAANPGSSLSIQITGAPALTSIAPLAGLIASNDGHASIFLSGLATLPSLDGLAALSDGVLVLRDLPQVQDLGPLADLVELQHLEITGLPKITALADLGNLEVVDTFILGNCDAGPDIPGMDGLVDLSGLDSLVNAHIFQIGGNQHLTALTGAPALHQSFAVWASDNPALTVADYDALLAQLDEPAQGCFGNGNRSCTCNTKEP